MKLSRVLVALVLFGVAFGYVEAAVVVYLRTIGEPIRREVLGEEPDDEVFPLLRWEQLQDSGKEYARALLVELGREFATMVLLTAMGLAIARNFRQWLAAFMIAFGIWDIFYYVFLRLLLGWPESLWTWDVLFMLPVLWVAPVIAPVLVAVTMIAAGVAILWRESRGRPIHFRWSHWLTILGGGLVIIVAFCWDCQNTGAGGWPNPFKWSVFIPGELIGLAGFVHAFCASAGVPAGDRSVP